LLAARDRFDHAVEGCIDRAYLVMPFFVKAAKVAARDAR
jgi:hypothetical protein